MTITAKLDELIDALEAQSDTLFAFLDRETGAVELMSDESLSLSDSEPEEIALLPDWQQEEAELAVRIETTDRYLALPDRFDVNEWNIMNDFCHQIRREDIQNGLLRAIQGNPAFRRFKDKIADHNHVGRMESISPPRLRGNHTRLVRGERHLPRRPAKAIGSAQKLRKGLRKKHCNSTSEPLAFLRDSR
jgi:hypothetical protein